MLGRLIGKTIVEVVKAPVVIVNEVSKGVFGSEKK